jgi:hypothetical protein
LARKYCSTRSQYVPHSSFASSKASIFPIGIVVFNFNKFACSLNNPRRQL